MDSLYHGKFYEFDNDFKNLPMENRVKLINIAKTLLNIQKSSRDNAPLAVLPMETEKQGLSVLFWNYGAVKPGETEC